MNKMLAFFFRRPNETAHDDTLRAGADVRHGCVSPYIAAMLPRVD